MLTLQTFLRDRHAAACRLSRHATSASCHDDALRLLAPVFRSIASLATAREGVENQLDIVHRESECAGGRLGERFKRADDEVGDPMIE